MYQAATAIGRNISENLQGKPHAALIGNSSFEWYSSYLGLMYYGIVAIPLDRQLSKEALLVQLDFADADVLLYDDLYDDVAEYIKANTKCCKRFINFDKKGDDEYFWDIVNADRQTPDEKNIRIDPKQLAEIVFTSGTTGTSKGVMLSHENLATNVMFGTSLVTMNPGGTVLSVMPNNHTYELTAGIMIPVYFGMSIAINENIGHLIANFKIYKPDMILVVPLLLKIFRKEILAKIKKQNKTAAFHFGIKLNKFLKIFHADISHKLFKEIHDFFGGNLKSIVCGASFLKEEIKTFFNDIGIYIIEGYGLTETSPIISGNSDRFTKKGTVGKVGPMCKVKSVDGELYVTGQNVMLGYYKNPELTAQVMEDGWLKTGDLGFVDEENFITLTGRKKNLIILSNGENVSPEELENLLEDIDIIDSCVVYEKDDQIAVEVFPKENYIKENNIADPYDAVCVEIYKLNTKLPVYKQIQSIKLRSEPFEKTTTMKIKRNKIK